MKKHESYFCFQKNNCAINKITRNRCKACRFKKCLKEGMSIDGIRMGRIPKSEKLKSFNELENSGILLVFIIKYIEKKIYFRSLIMLFIFIWYLHCNYFQHFLQVLEAFAIFFYIKVIIFQQQIIQIRINYYLNIKKLN